VIILLVPEYLELRFVLLLEHSRISSVAHPHAVLVYSVPKVRASWPCAFRLQAQRLSLIFSAAVRSYPAAIAAQFRARSTTGCRVVCRLRLQNYGVLSSVEKPRLWQQARAVKAVW